MKVEDFRKQFISNFTNVRIVWDGTHNIFKGYAIDIPEDILKSEIDMIIPIVNPDNNKTGMLSILIKKR